MKNRQLRSTILSNLWEYDHWKVAVFYIVATNKAPMDPGCVVKPRRVKLQRDAWLAGTCCGGHRPGCGGSSWKSRPTIQQLMKGKQGSLRLLSAGEWTRDSGYNLMVEQTLWGISPTNQRVLCGRGKFWRLRVSLKHISGKGLWGS